MTDASGLTLDQIRTELTRLTALAISAERPRPTRINPPDHSMPGHEWVIVEDPVGSSGRAQEHVWYLRTVDAEAEETSYPSLVYLSTPDSMAPGEDFTCLTPLNARRIAMALLAAADRAEHLDAGIPRVEDRQKDPS